jgi:hypothetical protein
MLGRQHRFRSSSSRQICMWDIQSKVVHEKRVMELVGVCHAAFLPGKSRTAEMKQNSAAQGTVHEPSKPSEGAMSAFKRP